MYLDMSEVQRRMDALNHVILPARIRKGLELAGKKLINDALTQIPTVPIHRPGYPPMSMKQAGELRASGGLFVDGNSIPVLTYGETATGKYWTGQYGGTPIPPMSHEACVVFNAPYAATQHESFPEKTQKGAGMNYLGGKLTANAPEYIAIVVEAIKL